MEQTPGLLDDSCTSGCGEVLWLRTVGVQGLGFSVSKSKGSFSGDPTNRVTALREVGVHFGGALTKTLPCTGVCTGGPHLWKQTYPHVDSPRQPYLGKLE